MSNGFYAQRGFIFQRRVAAFYILKHYYWLDSFQAEPMADGSNTVDLLLLFSCNYSPYGNDLSCTQLKAQIKSGASFQNSPSDLSAKLGCVGGFFEKFSGCQEEARYSFAILTEKVEDKYPLQELKTDLIKIRSNANKTEFSSGKEEAVEDLRSLFGLDKADARFFRRVYIEDDLAFETLDIRHLLGEFKFRVNEESYQIDSKADFDYNDIALRVENLVEESILQQRPVSRRELDELLRRCFKDNFISAVAKKTLLEKFPWYATPTIDVCAKKISRPIEIEQTISARGAIENER